jgi:hypothetical protein
MTKGNLWARARRFGTAAGDWGKVAYRLFTPAGESLRHIDDAVITGLEPALERLLGLTLALKSSYKDPYWRSLPLELAGVSLMCGDHACVQGLLARRIAARLASLGHAVDVELPQTQPSAGVVSNEATRARLEWLRSEHLAVVREARASRPPRTTPAWASRAELVVADIAATNRRHAAAIARQLAVTA